jgi:transmembrane sensor
MDHIPLFQRYLKGRLTETEESDLYDWIKASPENYREFKNYLAVAQFSQSVNSETLQAWEKLHRKISRQSVRKIMIPGWFKIAAAIMLALLTGFVGNQLIRETYIRTASNEIIVPDGEQSQVILSDGTKIYLNAGTRLKYPVAFSERNRKVSIIGEAFFEVATDRVHPFLVETPGFKVKVTGTSFNLRAYPEDTENTLVLHTGVVTIILDNQEQTLKPGDQFVFNTRTQETGISRSDLRKSVLWREGIISFDNEGLPEIARILERRFDVQIRIMDDKLRKIRYTGQFKAYNNLDDILRMIKETSPIPFNYEINETKAIITTK